MQKPSCARKVLERHPLKVQGFGHSFRGDCPSLKAAGGVGGGGGGLGGGAAGGGVWGVMLILFVENSDMKEGSSGDCTN